MRIMLSRILGLRPCLSFQKILHAEKSLQWGVLRVGVSGGMDGVCKMIYQPELCFSIWPWTLPNTINSKYDSKPDV